MNHLYDGLSEVLLALLKNSDTRESVLQYLAEVINRNATRAHIQVGISCTWNFLSCSYSVYDLLKALS
jgi:ubiquitin conjugation factor E4 B